MFVPGFYDPDLDGPDTRTPAIVQDFVDACAAFPFAEHDDAVDNYSQAINWARQRGSGVSRYDNPATAQVGLPSSIPTGGDG